MKIVNENDNGVPAGERGKIPIRGHNIMKGYYKRPEANTEAFLGGWFHSSDVGIMAEDGYFFSVDRTKNMIIRGGFNVYPREVEEVLLSHPEVSLAAVIDVPHDVQGEEIKAFLIRNGNAKSSEADLVAWAEENMAAYKYPRIVEFKDELPMNATGKILKRELKAVS
ncbi:AMP-binding protein [Caldithrix abyssi]|nr:AMP-binding protein [Caldithrix abyssi]